MKKQEAQWLVLILLYQFGFPDVGILQPFGEQVPRARRSKWQITRMKPASVIVWNTSLLITAHFLPVEKSWRIISRQWKLPPWNVAHWMEEKQQSKKEKRKHKVNGFMRKWKKKNKHPCLFFFPPFPLPLPHPPVCSQWQKAASAETIAGQAAGANNKKSQIKVTEVESWRWRRSATRSACHVQLTFLSGTPVVSSVDGILCPRRRLSRGTPTNRKIFHCVSISNGERGEEGVRTEGGAGGGGEC